MSWTTDERARVLRALAELWPGDMGEFEAKAFEGALRRFEASKVLALLTRMKQEQTTNRRPLVAQLVQALRESGEGEEGPAAKLDNMLSKYGRAGRWVVRDDPVYGKRIFRLREHGVWIEGEGLAVDGGKLFLADPTAIGKSRRYFAGWSVLTVKQKERILRWCMDQGPLRHEELEEITFDEFLRRVEDGRVLIEDDKALAFVTRLLKGRGERGGGLRRAGEEDSPPLGA